MARNGVWELKEILLRYSPSSGSSRGVSDFVEDGLIAFARANPQIKIRTKLSGGHPCVYGYYITDYRRQHTLKNLSRDEVGAALQNLRDTLGRNVPKHREISIGVVERENRSVQGMWRNTPEFENRQLPHHAERRAQRARDYGLATILDEVGMAGVLSAAKRVSERREALRLQAVAEKPVKERVLPTE